MVDIKSMVKWSLGWTKITIIDNSDVWIYTLGMSAKIDPEAIYTSKELQEMFGVSRQLISKMVKEKKLPKEMSIGNKFLWRGATVLNSLATIPEDSMEPKSNPITTESQDPDPGLKTLAKEMEEFNG